MGPTFVLPQPDAFSSMALGRNSCIYAPFEIGWNLSLPQMCDRQENVVERTLVLEPEAPG